VQWDDLKYLLALFRAGTLSAAAREMGTEHTTIARRIASLEDELGIRLFDRSSKGFVLTPEGEAIVELATRVEQKAFDIERLAQGRQSDLKGVVRISAPPTFASAFLVQRLLPLRIQHPELELELVGDSRSASLSRREADIAIRLDRSATTSIFVRRIGALGFGLYGQRDYVERTCEESRDFLGYDDSLEHVPQQRWLRSVCGARKLAFRSNDLHTLHNAAAAGLGLAVLPRYLGDPDERLQRVAVDPAPDSRDLWLLIHPDLRRSPRFRTVFDHIVSVVGAEQRALEP
jgi:DNA-binding transcriptional LysR family regulator